MAYKGNNIVDGYIFKSINEAERARKELESINKLKAEIDINNGDKMEELYKKLVEKRCFVTPIGINFLHEMREYIVEELCIYDLPPVPVTSLIKTQAPDGIDINKFEKLKDELEKETVLRKKITIFLVAFLVIIVGMFFIIVTNDNLGYFNAEEKVLDKYSAWQERLESWEDELNEREEMLNNME